MWKRNMLSKSAAVNNNLGEMIATCSWIDLGQHIDFFLTYHSLFTIIWLNCIVTNDTKQRVHPIIIINRAVSYTCTFQQCFVNFNHEFWASWTVPLRVHEPPVKGLHHTEMKWLVDETYQGKQFLKSTVLHNYNSTTTDAYKNDSTFPDVIDTLTNEVNTIRD